MRLPFIHRERKGNLMLDDAFTMELVKLIHKYGHGVGWDKDARMIERLGVEFYTIPYDDGKGDYLQLKSDMSQDCSVKREKENGTS